jgi:hypothetical protein
MRIDICEIANMRIERRIRGMHFQLHTSSNDMQCVHHAEYIPDFS